MEAGGKHCEEETLQTAFKKLRVDAESSGTTVHVCEALASRTPPRTSAEGAKPKIACPKENWHGCMRKTSRGAVRSQRRRRSKSPILHPPKFTYCGSKMASLPGHLKHKSPADPEGPGSSVAVRAKRELLCAGHCSPVFGAAGYEAHLSASVEGAGSPQPSVRPPSDDESSSESGPLSGREPSSPDASAGGTEGGAGASSAASPDFQSLRELQEGRACSCGQAACRCPGWQGVEIYSFTGLRDVISECERKLPSPPDASSQSSLSQHRTPGSSGTGSAGSPRSCSEQARAYVDDITIEDLSGYMEYYLYIPKKMSHMAEMMYT